MFNTRTRIRFHDCDPAGILFFGRVYELCHFAYEEMIAGFDLNENYWDNEEYIVPIIRSEAHYHLPMKHGEEISISIAVKTLKASSFELEYLLTNADNAECVQVNTVHVFVDKSSWKKKAMSKEIFEGLKNHLA